MPEPVSQPRARGRRKRTLSVRGWHRLWVPHGFTQPFLQLTLDARGQGHREGIVPVEREPRRKWTTWYVDRAGETERRAVLDGRARERCSCAGRDVRFDRLSPGPRAGISDIRARRRLDRRARRLGSTSAANRTAILFIPFLIPLSFFVTPADMHDTRSAPARRQYPTCTGWM